MSEMLHRPRRTVSDLNTMHDKDVQMFFGIMGGKAGLQGMLDALNSDGALGQLNYWKGENTVMEDEQVWFGESRRSHVLDPFNNTTALHLIHTPLWCPCTSRRLRLWD